jgi:hypothetical protein
MTLRNFGFLIEPHTYVPENEVWLIDQERNIVACFFLEDDGDKNLGSFLDRATDMLKEHCKTGKS